MSSEKAPKSRHAVDLRLFVAGSGARSLRSIHNLKCACEKHAPGEYHLSIVDIYLHPEEASKSQIVAVPTLIRQFPQPVRMFVGEISAPSDLDSKFSWLWGATA